LKPEIENLLIEELSDLENGIDMITTDLKAKKGLTLDENLTQVDSIEFFKCLKNSHIGICKNGKNSL